MIPEVEFDVLLFSGRSTMEAVLLTCARLNELIVRRSEALPLRRVDTFFMDECKRRRTSYAHIKCDDAYWSAPDSKKFSDTVYDAIISRLNNCYVVLFSIGCIRCSRFLHYWHRTFSGFEECHFQNLSSYWKPKCAITAERFVELEEVGPFLGSIMTASAEFFVTAEENLHLQQSVDGYFDGIWRICTAWNIKRLVLKDLSILPTIVADKLFDNSGLEKVYFECYSLNLTPWIDSFVERFGTATKSDHVVRYILICHWNSLYLPLPSKFTHPTLTNVRPPEVYFPTVYLESPDDERCNVYAFHNAARKETLEVSHWENDANGQSHSVYVFQLKAD